MARRRVASLLIASVLAPLVVLFALQLPVSADQYGAAVAFTVSDASGDTPTLDMIQMTCNGKAAYRVNGTGSALTVVGSVKCSFDVQYAQDIDDWDEGHTARIRVNGNRISGGSCTGLDQDDHDLNSTLNFETAPLLSPGVPLPVVAMDCQVDEICVEFDGVYDGWAGGWNDQEHSFVGCTNITMGPPPVYVPETVCSNGMPTKAMTYRHELSGTFEGYHQHDFVINFRTTPTLTWTNSASSGGGWAFSARNSTYVEVDEFHEGEAIAGGYGWTSTSFNGPHDGTRHENATTPADHVPVGVAITDGRKTASYPAWLDTVAERKGLTVPQYCIFWFGPKIVDRPGDTYDNPFGPLDGAPVGPPTQPPPDTTPDEPVDEEGCNFDVGDPSSWLSGGMCAAVGVLKLIWQALIDLGEAVAGLAAAIAGAIGGLFIPSDGFFEAKMGEVSDAWDDTAPMVVADGIQDVASAATSVSVSSACQGPAWTFTEPVGGNSVTLHPFEACSGGMGQLASIVHTALTVMVYIGAYSTGLRIVSHVFGVDAKFQTGRGL